MSRPPRVLLNLARPRSESDPGALARAALAAGLDGVGLADSPRLFPDPFLAAERILSGTEVPLAGPCVMGLGLHHPAVVAQALASLEHHHGGRTFLAVGRGESSLRNENLPVPRMADYEASMALLRDRLGDLGVNAPVLGAASGPRTIAASARILDGVMIDAGADPSVIARAVETARAASSTARVWLFLRAVVTADEAASVAAAAPILGSCAARLVKSAEWFGVDPGLVERVAAVEAAHDYRRHGRADAGEGREPDPEAEALIRERFLLTGPAEQIAGRLGPLAGDGIDGVVLAGATAGITAELASTGGAVRAGLTPPTP